MLEMKKIFYRTVVAVCCGVLPFGCVKEDIASLGEQHNVAVQLNVGTRAVDAADGTPTNDESAIHTLRVYAFVGGKPAGHYFTNNVTMTETEASHTFFMDITFYSAGVQKVDFYAVANEAAMTGANPRLSENTTETQLKNLWFTGIQSAIQQYGLPMFCDKQSVDMDFTKVRNESPTDPDHADHSWIEHEDINFELKRPFGKLGVFAAKSDGETGTLRVTGLTMLEEGTRARNYLMTPAPDQLSGIGNSTGDISLSVVDGTVDKALKPDDDRADLSLYTPVLDAPFYPFENPWGNGGNWNIPGSEQKGHALKIDYEFDGEARTGLVYLPVVERNHYYAICCLMHNDGKITVEYTVADWDDDPEYEIEFNYPQYTNPIQPEDGSQLVGGNKYPQPTVSYDPNNNETSNYTFKFAITGPTGQKWTPTLVGDGLATQEHFQVKVYQVLSDGNKDYIYDNVENPDNDKLVASPDPYYITVKALKNENVDKEVGIGITYDRSWSTAGSSLLLINGLIGELKWEGSENAEVIMIKQVQQVP